MPDHTYLSIGEVLGLLLEDFPDVTISKIRFLESQGLIEPERTPSGYRKFYDHDVDLLRAILHEQRENYLPLKVIKDRISAGVIESETARTPPRGIRNVDPQPARDSVFRRTDGGPEWADGAELRPGAIDPAVITAAVPVVPEMPAHAPSQPQLELAASPEIVVHATVVEVVELAAVEPVDEEPVVEEPVELAEQPAVEEPAVDQPVEHVEEEPAAWSDDGPFTAHELCAAAQINAAQLEQLVSFGIVAHRGNGPDTTFEPDAVRIAELAGRFLDRGIDARHLRAWRQAAEREAALFEQRILPLLRQRNPQSRQLAVDTLVEMEAWGNELHDALVHTLLRHHLD